VQVERKLIDLLKSWREGTNILIRIVNIANKNCLYSKRKEFVLQQITTKLIGEKHMKFI
jgi:hypothetical protein